MKLKSTNFLLLIIVFFVKVISCDNETNVEFISNTENPPEGTESEMEAPSATEFPAQTVTVKVIANVTKSKPHSSKKGQSHKSSNVTVIVPKLSVKDLKIKELMAKLKKKAQERREQEAKRKQQKEQEKKGEESIIVELKFPHPNLAFAIKPEEQVNEEEQRERERLEQERLEQEQREKERLEQEKREQEEREEREEEERKKNMKVRIVTEMMLLRTGVPVDYSYNQTQTHPEEYVSAPGCPKSIDGYPWVKYTKHNETKCYLVGQISSVCEGSSVMNYRRDSEYGVCACNFNECRSKYTKSQMKQFQKVRYGYSATSRFKFCRPINVHCEQFVYDKKENQCFVLYTQGPCKENEWLQLDGKGGLECAARLCPSGKGLDEHSEKEQMVYRNLTKEAVSCCKSWGSYSVMNLMEKRSCRGGEEFYSEILAKCLVPFEEAGLIVG